MAKSPDHRSGLVQFDGSMLVFGASGNLTASAAAVRFGFFVAPCNGTVAWAGLAVHTALTHATSDLAFGTYADPDSHLDDLDIQNRAAGYYDLIGETWVTQAIVKGTAYSWTLTGGDTTGVISCSMIIRPD